jgi:hypothetical protein
MSNNYDYCYCHICREELKKGDRFILISIEKEDYICVRCFIRDELTILKVPEDTIKDLTKPAENIEEIKNILNI